MSKTLDIVMSLTDNVSPNLGKMNTNLQTTSGKLNAVGKSVGKLGGIIKGALVGGAVAKFSMDALKAYDIQVQAEKSVQRALEKTGKTATEAQQGLKEFKDFASKQQDITAFGDEGTLQVISGLISQGFGKKSIEDIVAMSQDIARSTGDEQENVTKALSAYVKTGKGAAKLAKVYKLNADLLGNGKTESERLAEVWKAFSQSSHMGASTEYLKTFDGQLQAVKGRFDDLKEPVGQFINTLLGGNSQGLSGAAGALAAVQDVIVSMTSDLQNVSDKAEKFGGGITGVGMACATQHPIVTAFLITLAGGKTLTALAGVTSAVNTLAAAFDALGISVGVIAGVAAGAISALAALYAIGQNWMSMAPEVRESLNETQREANGVFQSTPDMYQGGHSIFDKANANGTSYFAGGRTLVGEYGPELVDLPRGSSIKTNAQTQRELSGSGSTFNIPVTIQGNVIGNDEFIDQVGDAITNRVSLALANM